MRPTTELPKVSSTLITRLLYRAAAPSMVEAFRQRSNQRELFLGGGRHGCFWYTSSRFACPTRVVDSLVCQQPGAGQGVRAQGLHRSGVPILAHTSSRVEFQFLPPHLLLVPLCSLLLSCFLSLVRARPSRLRRSITSLQHVIVGLAVAYHGPHAPVR